MTTIPESLDFPDAHSDLGIVLLLLGGFEEGWRVYEHRLDCTVGAGINGGRGAKVVPIASDHVTPLPPFDFQVPLLSLPLAPGLFEPLAISDAYLRADPELHQDWRARLSPASSVRVGLVRAGSLGHKLDRIQSMRAEHLVPLLQLPGDGSAHRNRR